MIGEREAASPHGASPMMMSGFLALALEDEDGDERGEHGQDEDGREGARVRQVAVGEDPLGDLVPEHLARTGRRPGRG